MRYLDTPQPDHAEIEFSDYEVRCALVQYAKEAGYTPTDDAVLGTTEDGTTTLLYRQPKAPVGY